MIAKKKEAPECVLKTKWGNAGQLESIVYLGSTLTSDGRSNAKIKRGIEIAKKAFKVLGQALKNKNIF